MRRGPSHGWGAGTHHTPSLPLPSTIQLPANHASSLPLWVCDFRNYEPGSHFGGDEGGGESGDRGSHEGDTKHPENERVGVTTDRTACVQCLTEPTGPNCCGLGSGSWLVASLREKLAVHSWERLPRSSWTCSAEAASSHGRGAGEETPQGARPGSPVAADRRLTSPECSSNHRRWSNSDSRPATPLS